MENQHRKIKGYRELNAAEIEQMNRVKELGAEVGRMITEMEHGVDSDVDMRWLNIGKEDIQKGFMALTRSIAKPDFF